MRTTVVIDDDLLCAARSLARARSASVGKVISDLARRGLEASAPVTRKGSAKFPVFKVRPGSLPITLEDVKRQEDEP